MRGVNQLDNARADLILEHHDFRAREQCPVDVNLNRVTRMPIEPKSFKIVG